MIRLRNLAHLNRKYVTQRTWRAIQDHDVLGQAAKMSYYFLFALFPLLLFLTTLFGYFAQSADLRSTLLAYFHRTVPPVAYQLVVDTLDQVTRGAGNGKLSLGILATLWAGSKGMLATIEGLHVAYEIKDSRPWWKVRLLALGLTILFAVVTVAALILLLAGDKVGALMDARQPLGVVCHIIRWLAPLVLEVAAITALYRLGPDLKNWRWRWLTPGAVIAVAVWILASAGLQFYLRFFPSYNTSYGSLGAVMILMLWFYITSLAILVGAEVNSEVEKIVARACKPARQELHPAPA